jgi:hypothetical protein
MAAKKKETLTPMSFKFDAATVTNLEALVLELSAERGEKVSVTSAVRTAIRESLAARNAGENKSGKK